MIRFIEKAVSHHPKLSLKVNKGEHHRIMKTGWLGSVWIVESKRSYRVETTGDVGKYLNGEIIKLHGQNAGENTKGYKYWYIDSVDDVEKIIEIYGRLHG